MGFREIHHMQIIAEACAIWCRVVPAEDAYPFTAPRSNLSDEGEQIVGDPQRVFTNPSAWMSPYGVEVAQAGHLPGTGAT